MSTRDAVVALKRFGLGSRPGDIKRISDDPRGYLLQSLSKADAALIDDPKLEHSHVTFAAAMAAQRQQRLAREASTAGGGMQNAPGAVKAPSRPGDGSSQQGMTAEAARGAAGAATPAQPKAGQIRREVFVEEAAARFQQAASTDLPLVERLVMFWSNHFCVSANKGPVRGVAGAYEREAIRPYVLGRFADMLLAVEQHPAMLVYLDNARSAGPNSMAGINRGLGLNENLAREVLELHTLGADGGYAETDVTNFARILTGWSIGVLENSVAEPGRFFFAPRRHEPGDWTVLGKRYRDQGQLTGIQVLRDLARHPATAQHIATKLGRHFVADATPAALVERLAKTFRDTEGDLAAVTKVLIESSEAWEPAPSKVVPPYDYVIALVRGLALEPNPQELLRLTNMLGQPLWRPPAPAGWPDSDTAWAAPSAMRERLRIAEMAARQAAGIADPRALADELMGEVMGEHTRQAVARAETREQALQLLVMAPEFQRR